MRCIRQLQARETNPDWAMPRMDTSDGLDNSTVNVRSTADAYGINSNESPVERAQLFVSRVRVKKDGDGVGCVQQGRILSEEEQITPGLVLVKSSIDNQ